MDPAPTSTEGSAETAVPSLLPVYRVELVRERSLEMPAVNTPHEASAVLGEYLRGADREHFIVVMLAANGGLIGIHTAHVGSLDSCVVSAREVFKPAILANAANIVVAHNHPFGNLTPSRDDIAISRKLRDAGRLLDIQVLDPLVIGYDGEYASLKAEGLLS